MNNITIDDLLLKVKNYNPKEVEVIKKAYYFAEELHRGQKRQSGEDYIIHPLNVAYILADMYADRDTVCAGLLHDTLEDTPVTKEDIAENFNKTIANLVDGVTKISKMNFSSKEEQNYANTRKIITSITKDVRIIIIKLADRLHNMRTLQYKNSFKQKENSLETIEIFVPLAYYIGAYRIKNELEDISLRYLKSDKYKEIEDKKRKIEEESLVCLEDMASNINYNFIKNGIKNEIKIRTKNIYGIYKKLIDGYKLSDIHDLLALKKMVEEKGDCYRGLGLIHNMYHPVNDMFKDYICNPKTNMYSSLHTTVFAPDDRLVQAQIRTFEMDKVASFGLTAYWESKRGEARTIMQEQLNNKYQFFKSLTEINRVFGDNQDFVRQIKDELFSDNVYVYISNGEVIELPKGSTIIDLAYNLSEDTGNTLVGAIINDEYQRPEYILKNKDRVRIISDDLSFGPKEDWINIARTTKAKMKIREFNKG